MVVYVYAFYGNGTFRDAGKPTYSPDASANVKHFKV